MRTLVTLFVALTACGPDVTAWKGTWAGSGTLNTGRQPMPFTGQLTITDGAVFSGTTDPQGSPAQSFAASLTAAMVDGTKATFTGPSSVTLTATPAGDCTWQVTLDAADATRMDQSLDATARGKVTTQCMGGSTTTESYLLSFFGMRR